MSSNTKAFEDKMKSAVEHLERELKTVRAGRANPGVLVFELMKVALQFMNVNSSYTYIVQGLVIIVAVAIDIRKYLAKK